MADQYLMEQVMRLMSRVDALEAEVRRLGGSVGGNVGDAGGARGAGAADGREDASGKGAAVGRLGASLGGRADPAGAMRLFSTMTIKQHVAAQILANFGINADIAKVLHVTEDGAKGQVRALANKLGVRMRGQQAAILREAFKAVSPEDYLTLSGGLPLDWWENRADPDPYEELYRDVGKDRRKGVK